MSKNLHKVSVKSSVKSTAVRKAREKERLRETILDAARSLFEERGVTDVTMQDIARAIEYSVGTVYLHFQSKEDLFCALAAKGAEEIDTLVRQTIKKLDEPKDAEVFVNRFLDIFGRYGHFFDVLRFTAGNRSDVAPDISEKHLELLAEKTLRSLSECVEYFRKKTGNVDQAFDATYVAWVMLLGTAQVLGKGRNSILLERERDRDMLVKVIARFFTSDFDRLQPVLLAATAKT